MVWHKGAPICPSTASQGAKTLCIHPIWMWDAGNGGLKPQPWHRNIIQARPYHIFPKTHPHLNTYYSIRMHPYAHPLHLKLINTLYTSNMDVGCSQWGFSASTMTPAQHHTGLAIPLFSWNSPPHAHVMVQHKGAPICPSTASQGAKTLCIHPIWMWDAVNGGL